MYVYISICEDPIQSLPLQLVVNSSETSLARLLMCREVWRPCPKGTWTWFPVSLSLPEIWIVMKIHTYTYYMSLCGYVSKEEERALRNIYTCMQIDVCILWRQKTKTETDMERIVTHLPLLKREGEGQREGEIRILYLFSTFQMYASLFPQYHLASSLLSTCSSLISAVCVYWFALLRL